MAKAHVLARSTRQRASNLEEQAGAGREGMFVGRERERLRAWRCVRLGDVTGLQAGLPELSLASPAGLELVEEIIAELMNLECKTRSQWSDFMRTLSLGGLDPHASNSWSSPTSPNSLHGHGSPDTPAPDEVDASTHTQSEAEGHTGKRLDSELQHGRSGIKALVQRQLQCEASLVACLAEVEELLRRPLSLSMDRSPRFKQMMGLTLAITAGATIMAGSCLLAPYAAASVMPSVAAYVTPTHAVTGMFATSMVGTHMQARSTIDGCYLDKLLHFAAALGIDTQNIRPVPHA